MLTDGPGSSQIDYLNTTIMTPSQVINNVSMPSLPSPPHSILQLTTLATQVQILLSSPQTPTDRNLILHALYDWYRFTSHPNTTTLSRDELLIVLTLKLRALTCLHYNTATNFPSDIRINYARKAQVVAAELIIGFNMTGDSFQRGFVNYYLARAMVTLGEEGLLPGADEDGDEHGEKNREEYDGAGGEGRTKRVMQ